MEKLLQFFNFQYTVPEIILLGVLILTFLIQMYFYLGIYRKFSFHKKAKTDIKNQPISGDETETVLAQFKEKYSHLKVTKIPEEKQFHFGKKLAITVGIKATTNEWIVFTDADCKPNSKFWLRDIQQNFKENSSIVLGYGKYESEKGLLNKIIRFDTLFIAIKYFALIGSRKYM